MIKDEVKTLVDEKSSKPFDKDPIISISNTMLKVNNKLNILEAEDRMWTVH